MKNRCNNVKDKVYQYYGQLGIDVCNEWKDNFQTFYDWSINNGYNDKLSIDRIDVNGNYEPNNCRWVDMKTQRRNTHNTRNITIKGVTKCLKDWCNIYNLKYSTVHARLHRLHWNIEKALEIAKGNK